MNLKRSAVIVVSILVAGAGLLFAQANYFGSGLSGKLIKSAADGSAVAAVAGTDYNAPPAVGAIGYATGAGGAVTQITGRTTGVTLSKLCGTITTINSSLAVETAAQFTVTDTLVAIGDTVVVSQQSGANSGNTNVYCSGVGAGSFNITVADNNAAAGTAETGAILINFAVIKAVAN